MLNQLGRKLLTSYGTCSVMSERPCRRVVWHTWEEFWLSIPSLTRVFGSVSDPYWIRIKSGLDPYPDPDSESRRAKLPRKVEKLRNFMFWSAGCSLLRAEGFFCSLEVLSGGLRDRYLNCSFWSKDFIFIFYGCKFFPIFIHQNPGSGFGSVFSLKRCIRIRI